MPLVTVRHITLEPCNDREGLISIINALPQIVAENLTCEDEGGSLTASDVEVEEKEYGPHDINGDFDFSVTIDANLFPSREANLDERARRIEEQLRAILPVDLPMKYYIWLRLFPAFFVEGRVSVVR
jgi:hypothetical protein